MKKHPFFISPEVLDWRARHPGGLVLPESRKRRAYVHLKRAEHFLERDPSDDADLADCLGNLRRALTHRVQLLERLYKLRFPLAAGAKRHFLEILSQVRVVRPTFLHALLEARNSVEYRDRKPPSARRCRELSDAVWYFLRSTDPLVLNRRDDFELTRSEDENGNYVYWLQFRIKFSKAFRMKVKGWIPAALGSLDARNGWLKVEAEKLRVRSAHWSDDSEHGDKKIDDWWVEGLVAAEEKSVSSLLALAFEAE